MSRRGSVIAVLGAVLSASGCAKQGVAERCDTRNRNDDCASGLVCVSASKLQSIDNSLAPAGLCCPPAGELTNLDPACIQRSAIGGTDAGTGADGAPADGTPTGDAAPPRDAGPDGP